MSTLNRRFARHVEEVQVLGQHGGENLLADGRPYVALHARDENAVARLQVNERLRPEMLDGLDCRRKDN